MPLVLFAASQAPQSAGRTVEQSALNLEWTGWDGSVWPLTESRRVFVRADGVEGLNVPSHTAWTSSSPAVHGQGFRGFVVEPRELFWPVVVSAPPIEWADLDAGFWRSLQPGKYGTLKCTTPGGQSRKIRARFTDDGGHSYALNPGKTGYASYGVTLVADDPFWYGEPLTASWQSGGVQPFIPESGAPPFWISPGATVETAVASNPGDVDAWPVWTAKGPFTSVTFGVGGSVVEYPVAASEGSTLVVDTDPQVQTAWLDGGDATHLLGSVDFAPIPPGESVDLSLSLVGTGSVSLRVDPRYFKAW